MPRPSAIAPTRPLCPDTPSGSGTVDLTLVRGDGVTDATLARAVALLRGRLVLQGLEVGELAGPVELGARFALGRRPDQAGAELGPLADFLGATREGLHLVVVHAVVDPGSALARDIRLTGLGVHPTAAVTPEAELVRRALPAGFAPTLVVAGPALHAVDAGGTLLVHELGHALGLPHSAATVMTTAPTTGPCLQGFSQAELAVVSGRH